jgi:hypothetical protein
MSQTTWALYYRNKVYFGGTITSGAGSGKISIYDRQASTWSDVTTGPVVNAAVGRGRQPIIFRDRAFLLSTIDSGAGPVGGRRLFFSKTTDPSDFASTLDAGFIDLPDDITAMTATRTTLFLFTISACYSLNYTSIPTDGRLDLINPAIGAYYNGAIAYNNHVYFTGTAGVYNLINNNLYKISDVLKYESFPNSSGAYLLGNRMMITGNDGEYVYLFDTLRWTKYDKNVQFVGKGFSSQQYNVQLSGGRWYTIYLDYTLYPDTNELEVPVGIQASCRTKDYDSGIESFDSWKRLYTVVANLFTQGPTTPVGNMVVTVGDYNTTNDAVPEANIFPINYNFQTVPGYNSFKYHASLRVQRWHFDVEIVDSGTSPVSLYSLSSLAKVKQTQQSGSLSGSIG